MNEDQILKTAHIHLEQATFRVHVSNADNFDIEAMNENRPDYVNYISKSNDPTQRKTTLLVNVCDGYDLEEIAEWIKEFKKQ